MAVAPHRFPRQSVPALRLRPSASRRGYDADWQRVRLVVLSDEPLCRCCAAEGRTTAATQVDHIVALTDGGARLDRSNLQPLCDDCHGRKTAADVAARRRHP